MEQMVSVDENNQKEGVVNLEPSPPYASLSARMLAAMIDSIISVLPLALVAVLVNSAKPAIPDEIIIKATTGEPLNLQELEFLTQHLWFMFLNASSQLMLFGVVVVALWVKWSATPGKMLLGIKIVDEKTGQHPGWRQSIARMLGYFISTLPLLMGFFWMNFSKKKQCWHDSMAGTIVVYTENSIYQRVAKKYARLLSGRSE
jgi:uncharacterized RDD family membrane protein YckC